MATRWALSLSMEPSEKYLVQNIPLEPPMLVLAGQGTKTQVLLCYRSRISSFMEASQARFLAVDLKPLSLAEARNVERRPVELKTPRFAGWRLLKIPALARVSMGWELIRLEVIEIGGTVCATTGPDSAREESGPETELGEEGLGTEPKSYLNFKG